MAGNNFNKLLITYLQKPIVYHVMSYHTIIYLIMVYYLLF